MKILLLLLVSAFTALSQERPPQSKSPPGEPPRGRQRTNDSRSAASTNAPVAATVDETPVVTQHEILLGSRTLKYTATAAQMPIRTASEETEAHIFYMAYKLDGAN